MATHLSLAQVMETLAECFKEHQAKHPSYYIGYSTHGDMANTYAESIRTGCIGLGEVGRIACRRLGIPVNINSLRAILSK